MKIKLSKKVKSILFYLGWLVCYASLYFLFSKSCTIFFNELLVHSTFSITGMFLIITSIWAAMILGFKARRQEFDI